MKPKHFANLQTWARHLSHLRLAARPNICDASVCVFIRDAIEYPLSSALTFSYSTWKFDCVRIAAWEAIFTHAHGRIDKERFEAKRSTHLARSIGSAGALQLCTFQRDTCEIAQRETCLSPPEFDALRSHDAQFAESSNCACDLINTHSALGALCSLWRVRRARILGWLAWETSGKTVNGAAETGREMRGCSFIVRAGEPCNYGCSVKWILLIRLIENIQTPPRANLKLQSVTSVMWR